MIDRVIQIRNRFRVPVLWAGTLSFCLLLLSPCPVIANPLELALDLFEEGDWEQCRVECRRVMQTKEHAPQAHLLLTIAERRCGIDSTRMLQALCEDNLLKGPELDLARYELGHALRRTPTKAFPYLLQAFLNAESPNIFARSGLLLADIVDASPDIAANAPGLIPQLLSCRPLWTRDMYGQLESLPDRDRARLSGKPGEWLIAFYRSQIRPTIANRCTLEPSCSEYMRQALRKHGALGFAIYGDRGVREPEVVSARQSPVKINGQIRYQDPLHHHDWWLQKETAE